MQRNSLPFGTALVLALGLLLAGCPKKPTTQEEPPAATTEQTAPTHVERRRRGQPDE